METTLGLLQRDIEELRLRYPFLPAAQAPNGEGASDALLSALEGPSVPVFDPADLALATPKTASYDDKNANRRKQIAAQLKARGAQRLLGAVADDALVQRLEHVKTTHPCFVAVIDDLIVEVGLARRGLGALSGLPILLDGPPGVGKTDFCLTLADALGVPMRVLSMSAAQAGAQIVGSDEYWANTKPGGVFEAITEGRWANPIFVLDELDKVHGSNSGGDPVGALYQLLERRTACCFRDLSVPWLPVDARHVLWIATSNDLSRIEGALRSRFRVFQITPPSEAEQHALLQRLYRMELADCHAEDVLAPELALAHLTQLGAASAREARIAMRRAIGWALHRKERVITLELGASASAKPQRMGFL
ncbi:AAA family ATPase [Niveibacterium sp. 24ML]|uniref:AAA family ATPase n=1 Tax=Niveibacterium sp. 24ML TaxID=2985512 RepID=UPI00226FEF3C|nr:AAA family ATPase [Niveibacterium sp. 24ML]MCX9157779.1 AAA family ATPase [Niveibacterium sp. 24ML]